MNTTANALLEGFGQAVGQIIADQRREWRRERELIEAQARETVAELRARIVEIEAKVERSVAERLASLKDGAPGRSITVDDVAPIIAEHVGRAVAALPPAQAGKDADPAVIQRMVADAVAVLPPAEPGKDADPIVVARMVADAVAKLPPAKEGPPGKDADPAVIRAMVAEAVAALPPAEPGKSITVDEVAPMIAAEVAREVAKLPPCTSIKIGKGSPMKAAAPGDVYLDVESGDLYEFKS